MSENTTKTDESKRTQRVLFIVVLALAFFASYQIAQAVSNGSQGEELRYATSAQGIAAQAGSSCDSESGGSCCDTSGNAQAVEGAAVLGEDGIQRIAVDVSNGYNPNVILLQAGTPAHVTFGQGSGCMAEVMSADLGFFEDLQAGPVTIALDSLEPGTYGFSCGMEMVFGEIVVE